MNTRAPFVLVLLLVCAATVAGAATSVPATSTTIGMPGAVIVAPSGDLYFSSDPGVVFKVDAAGQLTRVAGGWTNGYSGDGGPATDALLSFPYTYPELQRDPTDYGPLVGGLAADAVGNLYVADNYNNRVRKITPDGLINTIAGANNPTGQFTGTGDLTGPSGVAVSASGQIYVAHWDGVGIVTAQGAITPLVPYNCGAPSQSSSVGICGPAQLSAGLDGQYYVIDGRCDVLAFGPDGLTHEVAGYTLGAAAPTNWPCGYAGDGGRALGAMLNGPGAAVTDRNGVLYIADTYNHCIRRVDTQGIIRTFAGHCGVTGFSGDGGPAAQALMGLPFGVALDGTGNVFIADTTNYRIREVTADGVINTVAGNGMAAPVVYSFKPLVISTPTVTSTATATATATVSSPSPGGSGAFDPLLLLTLGALLASRRVRS